MIKAINTKELINERIFKPIKSLDIEIRTIKEELNEDNITTYFIVEVGLYESLGEQGENTIFNYDSYPTEEEIIKDSKEELKRIYKELKEEYCLSGREEKYLKILKHTHL